MTELLPLLLRTALLTSAAILVLLAARRLLQRCFGAGAAYAAWLVVPAVMLAALLPARTAPQVMSVLSLPALQPVPALAALAAPAPGGGPTTLLLAWAAGVFATGLWFILAQRAFLRRAGTLTRAGAVYISAGGAGPASVGLLRPKIVVPFDFAQRYTAQEQALVIAHEQVHVARRDALANLGAVLLQCLFWFNPLLHLGVRAMRQDQELACDAAVMARHPQARRSYAEALLKSHTGFSVAAGIHCHWQTPHPTKERVMNLQQTVPGTLRRLAGRCVVALLAVSAAGATIAVHAEAPTAVSPAASASAPTYSVAMAIDTKAAAVPVRIKGGRFELDPRKGDKTPRVLTRAGESFSVAADVWRVEMTVRQADAPGEVWVATKLFADGELRGTPTLRSRLGENSTITVDNSGQPLILSLVVNLDN